jgi:hemolysin activation/secretion protein
MAMHALVRRVLVMAIAGIVGIVGAINCAYAQAIPDAGQMLRELPPLPSPPKTGPAIQFDSRPKRLTPGDIGLAVEVNAFRLTGVTAFAPEALQALLADRIGKQLSFADLEAADDAITAYYRERGYFAATAYLPAQTIKDGVVEITVLEGRLGKIKLESTPGLRLRDGIALGYLSHIPRDRALTESDLERPLLLLNDLPGIGVSSVLETGSDFGTGDLGVTITEGRLISGSVEVDNVGSISSGEHRLGVGVYLNDPLGLGDQLSLGGLTSQGGRLNSVSAAYLMPINTWGSKAQLSYSALDYRLGGDFSALDASGQAVVVGAKLSHPFIRSRSLNILGEMGFEAKDLEDRIGLVGSVTNKRLDNWTARLVADSTDGWMGGGTNTATLAATRGRLFLETRVQRDFDASALGRGSQGDFSKWTYSLNRQQTIAPRWSWYGAVNGQVASKNLDSSEKFSLGGPYGVRAYPVAAASGDEGITGNLELRYLLAPGALPGNWVLAAFLDAGRSTINKNTSAFDVDNVRKLYAYGVGVNWVGYKGFNLRSSLAWPGPAHSSEPTDRSPRFFMQLSTGL